MSYPEGLLSISKHRRNPRPYLVLHQGTEVCIRRAGREQRRWEKQQWPRLAEMGILPTLMFGMKDPSRLGCSWLQRRRISPSRDVVRICGDRGQGVAFEGRPRLLTIANMELSPQEWIPILMTFLIAQQVCGAGTVTYIYRVGI